MCKTFDYWSRYMLNVSFQEKGQGLVSPLHFAYDFSRKMFLMFYSTSWLNFIAWFPILREILGNMFIAIVCWSGCDVMKFEINLIFLIKSVCYVTKKSRQKFKYFENKKSFWGKLKIIFHHFQRPFNCQNMSQTCGCAF